MKTHVDLLWKFHGDSYFTENSQTEWQLLHKQILFQLIESTDDHSIELVFQLPIIGSYY